MKIKPLLFVHLAILILAGTFFWPVTRPLWDALDLSVFKTLNGTLKGHHYAQVFWALINHQLTDWVEDLVFIAFFVIAIRAAPRGEKLRRTAQCIFLLLYAACIIFFVNRMLFRESFDIPRNSPTLVVSHCTRISDEIFWLKVKDDSTSSFPGDHATTLLLFAGGYTLIAGWRLGRYACLYALFRALPRLIAGAHWFTDIAVGSLSITLFFLAWGYLTPLHIWMTSAIESFLRLFTIKRTKNPHQRSVNWAKGFLSMKVGLLIVLGLGLAYAAPFALEQLNQNPYPYFQNNPYLDKKTKKLMSPYLLPLDHAVKPKLDTLFSHRVISSKQTLLSAGFEIIASKESSFITVARHPDIPGYVFKLYLDSEKRTKKHVPHCEWLTRRCIGAEKIRNIIKKKAFALFCRAGQVALCSSCALFP